MMRMLRYLVLPREVTPFEDRYLRRMNKIALVFFWLHPPVFVGVAYLAGTSMFVAAGLSLASMIGPVLAYFGLSSRPRLVSMVYGFTAMLMGGALVYIGQGPMQIEMHFYFFVLLALLAVFGNPMVIITAAVTVAIHHFTVWLLLPRGVFNYDASFWTVAVHALFVVIESVAAVFVARSFFDNVIGLEQIVSERTRALDGRNRDMAVILDNVSQGFVSIGLDGTVGGEWSRALERWFGQPTTGGKIWTYLFEEDDQQQWMELGFESLADDFMPFEVAVAQLPHRITRAEREYHVDYQVIGAPPTGLLVVVTDITDELARARVEREQVEFVAVVEKASRDRAAFVAFMTEANELVRRCTDGGDRSRAEMQRDLHTLKGNAAVFGVASVAALCHTMEDELAQGDAPVSAALREVLGDTWSAFRERVSRSLGLTDRPSLVVDLEDYQRVLAAIPLAPEPPWAGRVKDWGKSSTRNRLAQLGDYAVALARRLDKPELDIVIEDHDVRLPLDQFASLWSALVHAVRNAVDHGVEPEAERTQAGKQPRSRLTLSTRIVEDQLWVEITDDGSGVDWDRVAAKARDLGLPASTQREREEALFTSGVSTAAHVTDTSGRGVGMDALRQTCRELGGRIEIHSQRGVGTKLSAIVPLAAIPRRRTRKTSLNTPPSVAP